MNLQRQQVISDQKRWKVMEMVWNLIEIIQKKAQKIGGITVMQSFYSKYRNTSLAILNNFQSKAQAIQISKQYQVPLVYINIFNTQQQEFIWKYFLNCFENSQILNQGFILWILFDKNYSIQQPHQKLNRQNNNQGFIECYYNDYVYKKVQIKNLPHNQQQIYQVLNKLRIEYYSINDEDQRILAQQKNRLNNIQRQQEQNQQKLQQAEFYGQDIFQMMRQNKINREVDQQNRQKQEQNLIIKDTIQSRNIQQKVEKKDTKIRNMQIVNKPVSQTKSRCRSQQPKKMRHTQQSLEFKSQKRQSKSQNKQQSTGKQ